LPDVRFRSVLIIQLGLEAMDATDVNPLHTTLLQIPLTDLDLDPRSDSRRTA
jgi:hypothetical protein